MGAERAFSTALLLLREPPGSAATVGLFDALAPLAAIRRHGLTGHNALLGGALPAYGIYDASDGRVAIAALEPHFQQRLYARLGCSSGSALSDVMKSRSAEAWEAWGESNDVPIVRCRDGEDTRQDWATSRDPVAVGWEPVESSACVPASAASHTAVSGLVRHRSWRSHRP
jgi:hypothetical protein